MSTYLKLNGWQVFMVVLTRKAGEGCQLFSEGGAVVLVPRELMEPLFLSPVSWAFHSSGRHSLCFLSPAPYVKVYLLDNGVCIAKKKTKVARKTLEPLYQQLLSFEESPQGKVLQVCTPC